MSVFDAAVSLNRSRRRYANASNEDVIEFLRSRGIRYTERGRGEKLDLSCPFAKWTHSTGHDNNPSFGIKFTNDGSVFVYNCFACGEKGNIFTFVKKWKEYYDEDISHLIKGDTYYDSLEDYGKPFKPSATKSNLIQADLSSIRGSLGKYHVSFQEMGISRETAKAWELGYDEKSGKMIFPVSTYTKVPVGWLERSPGKGFGFRYSHGFPSQEVFFGEHMLRGGNDIFIVKGIFDALRLWQLGESALAILGSELSNDQLHRLVYMLPYPARLFVMMDGSDSGVRATVRICRKLSPLGVPVIPINVFGDPVSMNDKEIQDWITLARQS